MEMDLSPLSLIKNNTFEDKEKPNKKDSDSDSDDKTSSEDPLDQF